MWLTKAASKRIVVRPILLQFTVIASFKVIVKFGASGRLRIQHIMDKFNLGCIATLSSHSVHIRYFFQMKRYFRNGTELQLLAFPSVLRTIR